MLLPAVVHEHRVQAVLDLGNAGLVDIALELLLERALHVELREHALVHDRHPDLLGVDGVDEHLLHGGPL